MQAVELRRVSSSTDLLRPGEYVFIPKREPEIIIERQSIGPPSGFFKWIWWKWFGKRHELKQYIELLWPETDTVILNCPQCGGPCTTTKYHKIISIEPLTLETPLTCPHCGTNGFSIKDGKITSVFNS
jgi:hypothetical protein